MKGLMFLQALIGCLLAVSSCTDTYLDEKPRSNLVVPHTLADFRGLLDNGPVMFSASELTEVLADDYYLQPAYWESFYDVMTRNAHIWATDIYGATTSSAAWTRPYLQAFYCNVVLDGLKDIPMTARNEVEWKNIRGSALFLRAYAFYEVAQLFAPVYNDATADRDPGIPLPLVGDVNERISRGTVRQTYARILADLSEAEELLWNGVDYSRPSRPALFALMARVCLSMGDYRRAGESASACLDLYADLADLNAGNRHHTSVIFLRYMNPPVMFRSTNTNLQIVDEVYGSYAAEDLRREKYYRINSAGKPYKYAAFHALGLYFFTGLDTDELFLIRAECRARTGGVFEAMDDLNHLLRHRFRKDDFTALDADSSEEALELILKERRKELVFRGVRWTDLRRLGVEAPVTLTRRLGDQEYLLPSGSNRWVLPIPPDEIMGSGIPQNER